MLRRKPHTLLVCLTFLITVFAAEALGYSIKQASAVNCTEDLFAPAVAQYKAITKVKPRPIMKVRPSAEAWPTAISQRWGRVPCCLPKPKTRGWEMSAEVIFARTKGKIRWNKGQYYTGYYGNQSPDLDLNSNLGVPDHGAVPSFSVGYRFRPHWSVRYSIMPMELTGSGGQLLNQVYYYGQGLGVKWQRLYQRVGLAYDPVRTYRARISIFGDYVRLDEKISGLRGACVTCPGGSGDTFDHSLNMGMAGVEFERCLKAGRWGNYLSCDCRAGIAFLDEAFGSDIAAGLKCNIPMGKGRYGYIGGGYRFVTFKKGYSDVEQIDTAIEGGYLKMGITF